MASAKVVVVGASVGGVHALGRLVETLPAGFPAPILVVQHVGNFPSILPELLARRTKLPVAHGSDGEKITDGRVYVAPPDQHMVLDGRRVRLNRGPKEHHSRPAIDPLFVSAALAFGPGAIGVVLTGMLDDGTAGLQAIKRRGGVAIVQEPEEAEAPSMPLSALRHVQIDRRARRDEMADALLDAVRQPEGRRVEAGPEALVHEHDLFLSKGNPMEHLKAIGHPSALVCPDCAGGLWEITDSNPVRYRCHTGHAYTARSLLHALSEATDSALWGAVRALQEESMLLREMAGTMRGGGDEVAAARLEKAAEVVDRRMEALREIVETVPAPAVQDEPREGALHG
jgi:two-component system, chemotaxis family, protein-glutamate methylesterase/glutaminase